VDFWPAPCERRTRLGLLYPIPAHAYPFSGSASSLTPAASSPAPSHVTRKGGQRLGVTLTGAISPGIQMLAPARGAHTIRVEAISMSLEALAPEVCAWTVPAIIRVAPSAFNADRVRVPIFSIPPQSPCCCVQDVAADQAPAQAMQGNAFLVLCRIEAPVKGCQAIRDVATLEVRAMNPLCPRHRRAGDSRDEGPMRQGLRADVQRGGRSPRQRRMIWSLVPTEAR